MIGNEWKRSNHIALYTTYLLLLRLYHTHTHFFYRYYYYYYYLFIVVFLLNSFRIQTLYHFFSFFKKKSFCLINNAPF